jgi:hypothetical protein
MFGEAGNCAVDPIIQQIVFHYDAVTFCIICEQVISGDGRPFTPNSLFSTLVRLPLAAGSSISAHRSQTATDDGEDHESSKGTDFADGLSIF